MRVSRGANDPLGRFPGPLDLGSLELVQGLAPGVGDGDRLPGAVVIGNLSRLSGRHRRAAPLILDGVFHLEALVAKPDRTYAHVDRGPVENRGEIGARGFGQNDAQAEEVVAFEKAEVLVVLQPRLLHVREVGGVVDMPLRVQVAVTDLNWMVAAKIR